MVQSHHPTREIATGDDVVSPDNPFPVGVIGRGGEQVDVSEDADGTNGRLNTNAYLTDRLGRHVKISQKGEILVGSNVDDVNVNFQYTVRSANTITTETGTGIFVFPGEDFAFEVEPGATGQFSISARLRALQ